MSVSGVSGSSSTASSSSTSTSSAATSLGANEFLTLLTTQLANQDPLNPMDDTQSVAQLAQFSQLQAQQNLEDSFTSFDQNFGILQSSGILGKNVVANDTSTGGSTSGTVSGISFSNGTPSFSITDSSGNVTTGHSLSQILSIS
jgi:flagellar basal-body rod modification protein FlgD